MSEEVETAKRLLDAVTDVLEGQDTDMALNVLGRMSSAYIASEGKGAKRALKAHTRNLRDYVNELRDYQRSGTVSMEV